MAFRNDTTITDKVIPWCKSGDAALTTDASSLPFYCHKALTVVGVRALVATAPTGAVLYADLHKDGVTMFTTQANRPHIHIGATDSGSWTVPDVTAVAAGSILTVNIDAIGSTLPGTQLTVEVRVRERL